MSEPGDEMGSADMSGVEMDCAGLAEVAAELALGVLTGRERAHAIAHLERCDTCREDVRQLMATSDGLLALLPPGEPPAGFETKVLDRLGLSVAVGRSDAHVLQPQHVRARRAPGARRGLGARRLVAAAAVAVAVIGAGVTGWRIGAVTATVPGSSAAAQAPLNSAALLTASNHDVGQVFVYQVFNYAGGKDQVGQQWMYMSVDLKSGNGTVTCQIVGADGKPTTAGWFRLTNGHGAWATSGAWGDGPVRSARLLAADGTVLATATFAQDYRG
jgi:hypothetical protein